MSAISVFQASGVTGNGKIRDSSSAADDRLDDDERDDGGDPFSPAAGGGRRQRLGGQYRRDERGAADAPAAKRLRPIATGDAVVVFTSGRGNRLRNERQASLHGGQVGQEFTVFR